MLQENKDWIVSRLISIGQDLTHALAMLEKDQSYKLQALKLRNMRDELVGIKIDIKRTKEITK